MTLETKTQHGPSPLGDCRPKYCITQYKGIGQARKEVLLWIE